MIEFNLGDRVVLIGEVTDTMAHHNGVIGVTVTFGEGVQRRVVVPSDVVQPVALLEMASAFDVVPYDRKRLMRTVQVVRRSIEPEAWAIVSDGSNLARDGEWEWESLPSSRTEEFFQRCRWSSAVEAIKFAQDHMKQYPTGYKT